MLKLPRLAVGTVQAEVDASPVVWALSNLLQREGLQTQVFHSQAKPVEVDGGKLVCGINSRYLDSWLMSPELCRESFVHGTNGSDLSLVLGRYASARYPDETEGGKLEALCHWLELPQVAIIDVSLLSDCQLPVLPSGVDSLLLDRVDLADLPRWRTTLESLWGVKVLGGLPEIPALRKIIAELPPEVPPCLAGCDELGDRLAESLKLKTLFRLAAGNDFPDVSPGQQQPTVFRPGTRLAGLTVAVAYDIAFHCYFPDVLDLLELQGATVVDFSPLRDDTLPVDTDVVYIGCGQPHRFATELSRNHCLAMALRNHVRQGRRIFAEGGGLAYLCSSLRLSTEGVDSAAVPMAGVLPAVATYHADAGAAQAAEITLSRDHWLGPAGAKLRGYRNDHWQIEPNGPLASYCANPGSELDLVGHHEAIGSRLHLNFAAQPDFLRRFASSATPSLNIGSAL